MISNCTATGKYASHQNFQACVAIWAMDQLDRYVIANAAAYLGLLPRSDDGAPILPPSPPGVVYDLVDVGLDAKGD